MRSSPRPSAPGRSGSCASCADGRFNVLCNKCGRNSYHVVPRQANRWHDFRVDMDWRNGGLVQFYVDGQMFHQATLSGADANCHWDGGIYWATDAPSPAHADRLHQQPERGRTRPVNIP